MPLEKPALEWRMFLHPQHFERRDRYHEDLLDARLAALSPYPWGLARLEIDPAALAAGAVRVVRATARFPSGELAILHGGEAPLTITLAAERTARPVDVFLGVADRSTTGPNAASGDVATRYRSVAAGMGATGPTLEPRLRLYVETDPRLPADKIRIARVRATRAGLELDPDVLPPSLCALEGTFLPGVIAGVVRALSERQRQLVAARGEREHEPLLIAPSQVPALLALSAIQQALAALGSPVSRRGPHPWKLHRILARLLGALEALDGRSEAIPSYSHEDSGPAFRVLAERLLAVVPAVARPPHEAFPFRRRDPNTFELAIDPAVLRRPAYLVLTGGARAALEENVPRHAKVASDAWLPTIITTATRGIELAPDFDPPASLPSSNHSACFRMNTNSEYFADALERGSLVFHFPNAPAELRVTLYGMGGRG